MTAKNLIKDGKNLEIHDRGYHAVTVKPTDNGSLRFDVPDYPDQSFVLKSEDIPSFIDYLQGVS